MAKNGGLILKYQIWNKDEYNTSGISSTVNSYDEAISFIKDQVHAANFNNVLTRADQIKSLEAYFPVFLDENGENMNAIYAGNISDGKHRYYIDTDRYVYDKNDNSIQIRFYIGRDANNEDIYIKDNRGEKYIASFIDNKLNDLSYYFVKILP